MQCLFELTGDGVGSADGQVLEATRLPEVERGAGRVPQVLVRELLPVMGRRAALPFTPAVVVARELVEQLRAIDQQPELEDVELGPLLVGQQDADRLVLLQHRLELTHRRRVVDDHARPHRLGKLDHLPQVGGGTGEDRQPPRRTPIDAAPHEGLDASQVVVHGPVAVRSLLGAAHHHIQLVLHILATHEPAPIDVQVAAGDRRAASYPCELPDGGFADDGHSTSRSRRDW